MMRRALLAVMLVGCLPDDDRPEPGSLFLTAEPSPATALGFGTDDGWTVTFERFVTAVGDVRLDSAEAGACNEYSDSDYEWLFDFTVAGREKVAIVYALGTCSVEFGFRPPSDDGTRLGPGASERDVTFMRVRASDAYAENERVAVVVRGRAERLGVSRRFDWLFRRRYELTDCPHSSGSGLVSDVGLRGGDALELHIVITGEELFRETDEEAARLHFDPIAAADADGDGAVSLVELGEVEAPTDPNEERPGTTNPLGMSDDPPSMADLIYEQLLPRIARLAGGGACEPELDDGW